MLRVSSRACVLRLRDYDIDLMIYTNGWGPMDALVSPSGLKSDLKKDGLHWKFARAGGSAVVFTARWKIDIDTYIIVLNANKPYKANTKVSPC